MVSSSVTGFSTTHNQLRTKQNESSLDILLGKKRKDLTEVFFLNILFIIHLLFFLFCFSRYISVEGSKAIVSMFTLLAELKNNTEDFKLWQFCLNQSASHVHN